VTPDDLIEIEAIKQLKARYFRLLDTKQWDAWGDLFTDDVVFVDTSAPGDRMEGREAIVAQLRKLLGPATTTHHGHMPEIELTGPTTATGVWAMFDYVHLPQVDPPVTFEGWGHYHEEYVKADDGTWRIARLRLSRLRIDPKG